MIQKTILSDFDGTLVDSLGYIKLAFKDFLTSLHYEWHDRFFHEFSGPPLCEVIRKMKERFSIPDSEEILKQRYMEIANELYKKVQPNPGALDLLEKAKRNQTSVIIVTSNEKTILKNWLTHHQLHSYVSGYITGNDTLHGKPHPEPYIKGLALSNGTLLHTVALEDTVMGAQSAVDASLKTFCLLNENTRNSTHLPAFKNVTWIQSLLELPTWIT